MPEVIADAELVARSRGRDAEAFGQLVERHQPLVFGVALARCGDPVLAEDVAQDAFVAAWRDLDRLRDAERVGPWVAGIARNLAVTAVRARARIEPLRDDEDDRIATGSPVDDAIAREDRALLLRALGEIPDTFREVLVLHYMDGASVTAIADALGIREDLVKQRLSRGRKALRDSVAARVESALSRARVRPGFRVGVIAAAASGAAARTAAAATSNMAGKALAIMTTKQLAVGIATVLALVGGAIWLGTRGTGAAARAASEHAAHVSGPGSVVASVGSGSASASGVQRLADPTQRTAMLEAIRQQRTRRTGGTPSPSSSGSTPPPALPAADLDKEYIKASVRELLPLLSECYEQALERDPKLGGEVVIKFTIEGEPGVGGVIGESKVDAEHSTLHDPAMSECLEQTMYAIQIDPPAGGGIVDVTYPFAFSNDDSDTGSAAR